jgi:hypothetical protein
MYWIVTIRNYSLSECETIALDEDPIIWLAKLRRELQQSIALLGMWPIPVEIYLAVEETLE